MTAVSCLSKSSGTSAKKNSSKTSPGGTSYTAFGANGSYISGQPQYIKYYYVILMSPLLQKNTPHLKNKMKDGLSAYLESCEACDVSSAILELARPNVAVKVSLVASASCFLTADSCTNRNETKRLFVSLHKHDYLMTAIFEKICFQKLCTS